MKREATVSQKVRKYDSMLFQGLYVKQKELMYVIIQNSYIFELINLIYNSSLK